MIDGTHKELCYKPAYELRRMIDEKKISIEELTRSFLERIEKVNPSVNAIVAFRPESAIQEAKALDAREGNRDLPLFGIPLTVKDLNETIDMPTTLGSTILKEFYPGYEALIITWLKEAGAIVLGKTNTPEFGLLAVADNKLFGPTRNPWNLEHTSGGSSGGAGAAIAAGISPLSQGNDGGGSLRIPAFCNGIYSIKPTRGRVPWAPGSYEFWAGIATNGPMARTVKDAALMLDVIGKPVVGEPYGVPEPKEPFVSACDRKPPKLRLAYTTNPPHGHVDDEVKEKFMEGVKVFESLGHTVVEATPDLSGLRKIFMCIVSVNTANTFKTFQIPEDKYDELMSNSLQLGLQGLEVSGVDYNEAVISARLKSAQIMSFWQDYDFLLTPTLTQLSPRIDTMSRILNTEALDWLAFTYPFNITGQPAVSLPCGWSKDENLPVGLQIIGPTASEENLISLSAQFEATRPWHDLYPT
ncbi:MAG: amidase [Dissulfuribacterales bacterium]